jgi:hypothetical protein
MRYTLTLVALNRPFDDQTQERIRLETEAVLSVLTRLVEGEETLLWSWVMSFENSKHPRPDRRDEIAVWQTKAERTVELSDRIQERAREFAQTRDSRVGCGAFGSGGNWRRRRRIDL